jgi:hypothetical protein
MKEFKTRKAEASNKVTELTERRDKLGEVSWQISSKTRVFFPFLTVIVLLRLDRVSKKQEMIFKIARMN